MKSFIIGVIIFICFMLFYDVQIPVDQIYSIINFVTTILIIVFAICGVYMVSNNLYTKIDACACIMAASYIFTAMLLIINIVCIVNQNMNIDIMVQVRQNNLYRNLIEVVVLMLVAEFISEESNIRYWIFTIIGVTLMIIFFSVSRNLLNCGNEKLYSELDKITGICVVCIALGGWIIQRYKLKKDNFLENKIFNMLYLNRIVAGMIIVHVIRPSIIINTLYNLLDLIFYIGVFSYICNATLDVEWRSIELRIDSREEEVQRKLIEKRILVASAKSVRKKIAYMNQVAKHIKEIAEKKNMTSQVN